VAPHNDPFGGLKFKKVKKPEELAATQNFKMYHEPDLLLSLEVWWCICFRAVSIGFHLQRPGEDSRAP
jgi:hypothetical protein